MALWVDIERFIRTQGRAALVTLMDVRGSSPRAPGAWMAVRLDGGFSGTIGGGALEWEALADASSLLAAERLQGSTRRYALGPDLGQCCGGSVKLRIEVFDRGDLTWITPLALAEWDGAIRTWGHTDPAGRLVRALAPSMDQARSPLNAAEGGIEEVFGTARTALFLFGAGHVGRALVLALAPLPFAVTWIDPRRDAFPSALPASVRAIQSRAPPDELSAAAPGTCVLIMTYSHALDLAIAAAALADDRFPFVGLIGSLTKRARFRAQLRQAGMDLDRFERLICPIGNPDLGKEPAAIAAGAVVQLLQTRQALTTPTRPNEAQVLHV